MGDGRVFGGAVSIVHVGDRHQNSIFGVVDCLANRAQRIRSFLHRLFALPFVNFTNKLVDLTKNGLVARDSPLVSAGEDMLVIVFKLLPADCADHMVRAGLRLFEAHWVFFVWQ